MTTDPTPRRPPTADPPIPRVDVAADLARLDVETAALIATMTGIGDADWEGASRCSGWTRGHVATHLARNADSLINLVTWATTGVVTPQYSSAQAREADIEAGSSRPGPALHEDVTASAERFRAAATGLLGPLASPVVQLRVGSLAAVELPRRRIGEVVIHHADLLAGWDLDQAQPQSLLESLALSVERLRAADEPPNLTLRSGGDEWVVGTGDQLVVGTAGGILGWLTRGVTDGVSTDEARPLPSLPAWG